MKAKEAKKAKKEKRKPIRIDFDINSRTIIEIYDISPDGRTIETNGGWESAYQHGRITQRPIHVPGFTTKDQIEYAIQSERDILKDKKFKDTAAYVVAKKYPIAEWLRENKA